MVMFLVELLSLGVKVSITGMFIFGRGRRCKAGWLKSRENRKN